MWLTRSAAGWALRFYRDHFLLVVGLSLIGAAQRFVTIYWDDFLPGWTGLAGEVVTMAARVLLGWFALRAAFHGRFREPLRQVGAGIDRHLRTFLAQLLVLAVAFVVFDVLPTGAIALWVPDEQRDLATAALVALKNPTVIAFTFLWMAGIAHALMRAGNAAGSDGPAAAPRDLRP